MSKLLTPQRVFFTAWFCLLLHLLVPPATRKRCEVCGLKKMVKPFYPQVDSKDIRNRYGHCGVTTQDRRLLGPGGSHVHTHKKKARNCTEKKKGRKIRVEKKRHSGSPFYGTKRSPSLSAGLQRKRRITYFCVRSSETISEPSNNWRSQFEQYILCIEKWMPKNLMC